MTNKLIPWTCVRSACGLKGLIVLAPADVLRVKRCLECGHGLMPALRTYTPSEAALAAESRSAYPQHMGDWHPDEDRRPSTSRRTVRWNDHGCDLAWVYEVRVGHQAGSMRLGELVVHGTKDGELLCSLVQEAETAQ